MVPYQLKGSREIDSILMNVAHVMIHTTDMNSGVLINILLSFCLNVTLSFEELFLFHLQDQFLFLCIPIEFVIHFLAPSGFFYLPLEFQFAT